MKTNTFLAALLTSSALTAAVAGGVYASGGGDKHDDAGKIAAIMAAPVTLTQAIGTAEEESRGITVEAEVEKEDGRLVYEVTTLSGGKVYEFEIDPQNGAVLEKEVEAAEADELPSGSFVEITRAMTAAEAAGNGKAIEAELEMEDGQALYEIEVVSGTAVMEILVDATTGEVIALDGGRHDDGDHDDGDHDDRDHDDRDHDDRDHDDD